MLLASGYFFLKKIILGVLIYLYTGMTVLIFVPMLEKYSAAKIII